MQRNACETNCFWSMPLLNYLRVISILFHLDVGILEVYSAYPLVGQPTFFSSKLLPLWWITPQHPQPCSGSHRRAHLAERSSRGDKRWICPGKGYTRILSSEYTQAIHCGYDVCLVQHVIQRSINIVGIQESTKQFVATLVGKAMIKDWILGYPSLRQTQMRKVSAGAMRVGAPQV